MKKTMLLVGFLMLTTVSAQAATERQCSNVYNNCVSGCNVGSGGRANGSYHMCLGVCQNNYSACVDDSRRDPRNDPRHDPYRPPRHDDRRDRHDRDEISASCSPEVVGNNMVALDKNLTELSASAEFSNAQSFKSVVAGISTLSSSKDKIDSYFALIGIDGSNNETVAEFLGAREAKAEWISSLKQTTNVSDHQAQKIIDTVNKSLVGELQ